MNKLNSALSIIFYLIWIPLGIILLAGAIFLIVANPFAGITEALESLGGAAGGFPGPPGGSGGFPTEEQIRQFMEQGPGGTGPNGGQFGPPPGESGPPSQ